jgi:hypothetical protein
MRKLFLSSIIWLAAVSAGNAQENPRYQIIALPPVATDTGHNALIIDTQAGFLWEYWSGPSADDKKINEGITFLGKVTPGSVPGETIPILKRLLKIQ